MKRAQIAIRYRKIALTCVLISCLLCIAGCYSPISSTEQVREFEMAGPVVPEDAYPLSGYGQGRTTDYTGPYRVIPGDLLELQIPITLMDISPPASGSFQKVESYSCRVTNAGTITLPIAGAIPVVGKTVAEIESSVISAHFPRYVVNPPMVVCEVAKYQNESESVFTVMGLVNRPDAFPYPPDVRYNLMEALAFAGGFDLVADPRYVKIYRQDADSDVVSATFGIDDDSLGKAYDIMIKPGDVIYVDHTLRTRTNQFLSNVFRIGVGADVRYSQ